ncbi:MAG: bacillolysin [Streptosporangiales bacterium]|nr:bacillolysin [Streptosporangiales bacterium]
MTASRRTRVAAAVVAGLTTATMSSMLAAASATAAPADAVPADVTLVRTRQSLLGTHQWYAQTYRGLPVVGGYYARHLDRSGRVQSVSDGRDAVPAGLSTKPAVSGPAATSTAVDAVRTRVTRQADIDKDSGYVPAADHSSARLAVRGGASPTLVWQVTTRSTGGAARTLVDADDGRTLEVRSLSRAITGRGRVFDPNAVVALRDETLQDENDKNLEVFWPAYKNVALRNLDGSGRLVGPYVRITKATGGLASSDENRFVYQRKNDRFEQVMAYYHLNQTQEYIHGLGFTDVNNESQDVETNTFAGDNSFYDPSTDTITFGRGGVDDAEDAEVIWHEYGHAIQDDQVPGYGESQEAGAIGEGFGDYWAATMSVPVSRNFDLPCIADWDAVSYTTTEPHCLRRTDTAKTTDDATGEVHDDGEIWSAALWDINRTLGRQRADKAILESQFFYAPDTSFADAARDVVAATRHLYGAGAAAAATRAFEERKIL